MSFHTMNQELNYLPTLLTTLHQHHLHTRPQNEPVFIRTAIMKEWSRHLSRYIDQPAKQILIILQQLERAYHSQPLHAWLNLIEQLPLFPGYPFLTKGNFADHINYVCHYLGTVTRSRMPTTPIFAFHKTASSFISVVLCQLLNISPTVLSFDHQRGVAGWIKAFSKWGGVTHDHYYPSAANIQLLKAAGIKQCIIHHRKPADTLISFAHHWLNKHADQQIPFNQFIDEEMPTILRYQAAWQRLWRQAAEQHQITLIETHYETMKADTLTFFKTLLAALNVTYDESCLKQILLELNQSTQHYNFRKASKNEWREVLTVSQIERLKQLLATEFAGTAYATLDE